MILRSVVRQFRTSKVVLVTDISEPKEGTEVSPSKTSAKSLGKGGVDRAHLSF